MKNLKNYLILIMLLALMTSLSCKKSNEAEGSQSINTSIKDTINALETIRQKEEFLESLFDRDQAVRNDDEEYEILKRNNFDRRSSEFQEYMRSMFLVDSINFLKTKQYLEIYGHPNKELFSDKAIYAIKTICLHQSYDEQLELFPYLLKGYRNGDINSDDFSFLLNDMHRSTYGKSYPHEKTSEKNIKALMKKLNLEGI